jgi:CubicO group peptidase (beta-lactamase class C family)
MATLDQVSPLGASVSYNNASLSLAGRMIEKVVGTTYEQAIRDLVLEPLGLDHTFFFMNEIMTSRFAVGHTRQGDGRTTVARPWSLPRSGNPAGGMSATVGDQISWARFHLGDGTAPDGSRVLSQAMLERMQRPTADMSGSALGDHVGISWLIRDANGARIIGHGGTTNGQHSEFTMVPERRFALVSLTNCGPNGAQFNRDLVRWAHQHYLGLIDDEPKPLTLTDEALAEYTGHYETIAAVCDITIESGHLSAKVTIKPEAAAELREAGSDEPDDEPPIPLALVDAAPDRYVVIDGPAKGMAGYFARDDRGRIDGVHMGGRLAARTTTVPV